MDLKLKLILEIGFKNEIEMKMKNLKVNQNHLDLLEKLCKKRQDSLELKLYSSLSGRIETNSPEEKWCVESAGLEYILEQIDKLK